MGDNVSTINKSFDKMRTWKNNMEKNTATKVELDKIQDIMNKHQVETATKVDNLTKDISDRMQEVASKADMNNIRKFFQ